MQNRSLEGKSIVVIGGSTGIGLSAAKAFVKHGAGIVIVGRDAQGVAAALKELGTSACGFAANAIRPQTSVRAIDAALKKYGRFDGLYHIAGGSGRKFGDGPLHELTDEGWRATMDLNLSSMMFSNRAAVRQFLKQRRGGSILNLGSVLAWSPSPKHFSTHGYTAAKSAMVGFTRAVASYYAGRNIRCNLLAPGLVETPMSQRAMKDAAIRRFIRGKQPLDGGRFGQPGDLDAAAVFFLSDSSRFTTGQVLAVDGGWTVSEAQ